jgi:transcriptional regulator with XRE-family HTH domain
MEHPTPTSAAIAAEVTRLIDASGLSRRDVANRTGIALTTLTRRLTGTSPFSITELAAVASLLGTTVSSLAEAAERAAA